MGERRKGGSGGRAGEGDVGKVWRREIPRATVGKVRVRDSLEGAIARAAARAAEVGGREQRPVTTLSAIQARTVRNAHKRSPWESRVDIEDAAERPAASDLFHPTITAVEEDRLPHAKDLERLADVVVAASIIQVLVERIGLLRKRSGTGVHALRPGELGVGRELVRELMFQLSEQGVIVTAAVQTPEVPAADLRVEGVA